MRKTTLEDLLKKSPKLRFSIISEEKAERRQIKKVLRDEGLPDVLEYDNFEDAWDRLQLSSTHIMAFTLSDSGGLDFLQQVIESARFRESPLIIFTDKIGEHSKLLSHADIQVLWEEDPMNALKVENAIMRILEKGVAKKSLLGSDSVGLSSYTTGITALNSGDFEKAKEGFRIALKENPEFVEAYLKMAEALIGLKDYEAAKRVLAKARSFQKDHPGALLLCGKIAIEANDKENATKMLNLLVEKHPSDVGYVVEIGNMALEKGWTDVAIGHYEKAKEEGPEVIHVYNRLGIAHSRAGQYDTAIVMYERALLLDENDAGIHFNIAMTYHRMGEEDKALEFFKKAGELDPEMGETNEWIEKLKKTPKAS